MVLIAAAVCTKGGKTMISRQFVEMSKARIEGLLAAFPKLMTAGKQHTFVETDSVRYVYQPMEKLYMLLITTKASNILEDLETLRLFSRVIPEYCRVLDEKEILDNAFNLIFAFDEIVALGYRESVNLAQIKTFVEMDSHEEKVYQAVRQTQEREAKQKMREKAKELQRQRMESIKRGGLPMGGRSGSGSGNNGVGSGGSLDGFGSSSSASMSGGSGRAAVSISNTKSASLSNTKAVPPRNALKLGGKTKDVDSFVDQLKSEGEKIANVVPVLGAGAGSSTGSTSSSSAARARPDQQTDDIHLRIEDKIVVRLNRDGGLQSFELSGMLTLRIADEQFGRVKIALENSDTKGLQLQTHPNVDKELFKQRSQIGLKNPTKPFPLNNDVGVLKWRWQTQDEAAVPLTINCWPSENGEGGCDVNIEYELEHTKLELQDVCITIPLPLNTSPSVASCDGDYRHDSRKNVLLWSHSIIDESSKNGAIEFSCPNSIPGDFFPVQMSFTSKVSYADLRVTAVLAVDDELPQKFSSETIFYADKYEIA